jgi:glycerophosphoryl diester phosphodiesterase
MVVTRALAIAAFVCCPFINGTAMAFDIEAHRGGRALFPENTLPAFANALTMGVTTLELDLGVTKDGAIVVSHERGLNPDLARDAAGVYVAPPGIPFVQLSLADVKTYDVGQIRPGSAYAAQFPDQQAIPGTRIPTLSERVTIQSFDWRTLQLVQKLAPTIPTVYLTQQKGPGATVSLDRASEWTAGFNPADYGKSLPRTIQAAGGAIWSPYFGDVDTELISEAHRLGLAVVVWTVNKPADMTRMIEIGVDGIISDHPDLLRQAASDQRVALPAGSPVIP